MPILLSRQAVKSRRQMQPKEATRIDAALARLDEDPERTDMDIRPLTGIPAFRLRVGGWRIIFRVDGDTIVVTRLGPRGDVYKR